MVRDPHIHLEVLNHVIANAKELGFVVLGLTFSPIKGPEGNIEFLLYLSKNSAKEEVENLVELIEKTVKDAQQLANP